MTRLKHIDELLLDEEYLEKKKKLLLKSHIITDTGCWNWTKGRNSRGRATVKIKGSMQYVSRVSYLIFNMKAIGDFYVLHKCDNPACINPDHLWLGDQFDNMRDMVSKGRNADNSGESNPFSKLSEKDIDGIKSMVQSGHTLAATALKYGISYPHVSRIIKKVAWSHNE